MPSRNRGRFGLAQSLDREIYQVVRKTLDESPARVGAAAIYDEIRRSNSSLNRKPKKLLVDSIERVLATIQQDEDETDADGLVEQSEINATQPQPSFNSVNRSIVGAWSTTANSKSASTTVAVADQDQPSDITEAAKSTTMSEPVAHKRQINGEPLPKRRKAATATVVDRSPPTDVTLADVGGIENLLDDLETLLGLPLKSPEAFVNSRIRPTRGVLIHGPPGCGKTMVANAIAAEFGVSFISIAAPSIVSGMSGESEKALRDHFEEAKNCAPCLMFIDEIDAITPKREGSQREMEKRIVAQLLACMDGLDLAKTNGKPVIVMAATNRPDALDPALRRAGRFDKEINMSVPDETAREKILQAMLRNLSVSSDVNYTLLARRTPGFVGADLQDLVDTAGKAVMRRVVNTYKSQGGISKMDVDRLTSFRQFLKFLDDQHQSTEAAPEQQNLQIQITMADLLASLPKVQPSALREGFATIPSTTFDAIGALSTHKSVLRKTIIRPILEPEDFASLGVLPPAGVLLWGPPGCGKTLLAKAVANSSHANFIAVNGPELLNKYVGESERAVRQVFVRARSSVPVIVFFDEFDALVPRRESSLSEASARVVNTFLSQLDGVGLSREGIYIVAATNRPDTIDPAILRPGRLDTLLYVGLPDQEGRVDILKTLCKKLPNFQWSDELANVARGCDGFSGADLQNLLQQAGFAALDRYDNLAVENPSTQVPATKTITLQDFQVARAEVEASVHPDEMRRFERLRSQWGKRK